MSTDSEHEVVREEELGDDQLVYFIDLPTLQQMASYQVSLAIWYGYISSPRPILWPSSCNIWDWLPYLGVKTTYERDIDELIEDLRTPRRIEEMLKKAAKKIPQELADWAKHLGEDIFPKVMGECSLLRIDSTWCVWMANGEIDYRKSAEKMLNSGCLNDAQKFVVMGKYCMEDGIKTISLESLPKCVKNVDYYYEPVLFYWICYLRNKLHEVPIIHYDSLDISMALECYDRQEMALEYFLHRSSNIIHLYDLVTNVSNARSWSIFERLFASTDAYPISYCIEQKVKCSLIYSKSSTYPLRLWINFKASVNCDNFGRIIEQMLQHGIGDEEKMELLMNVWNTADYHHKDHVIQILSCKIFEQFLYVQPDSPCSAAYEFLYSYISLIPTRAEWRKVLDKDTTRALLFACVPDAFAAEMIKLCSFDRPTILITQGYTVVYCITHMFKRYGYSIMNGNFDHWIAKLDWLCSGSKPFAVREKMNFLKAALKSASTSLYVMKDFRKWNKLSCFIDETCSENTLQAMQFKRAFIDELTRLHFMNIRFRDAFDDIKKIIESVYSSEQLNQYKRDCLVKLNVELQNPQYWRHEVAYDESFFENFVDWCCDSDQAKISQFREDTPLRGLITTVLHGVIEKDLYVMYDVYEFQRPTLARILLNRLQKYLTWRLGDENNANEYKLRRINSCFSDLNNNYKELLMKNESCLMVVLKWFFNGCETQALEFRSKENLNFSIGESN